MSEGMTIEEVLEMKAEALLTDDPTEKASVDERLTRLVEKLRADRHLFNTQGTSSTRKPKKVTAADKAADQLLLGSNISFDDLGD